MSTYFQNPNPTPGSGNSFADVEIHLPTPICFIAVASGPPNGHLYFHTMPLSKIAGVGEIPVNGNEAWIPLEGLPRSYPVIKLKTPLRTFFLTGDCDAGGPPDFMLIFSDDFELLPLQSGNDIASNGVNTGQVSVTNAATKIDAKNHDRVGILIVNHGTTDVFIGKSSAVTTAIGVLLPGVKGAALSIPTTSDVRASRRARRRQ